MSWWVTFKISATGLRVKVKIHVNVHASYWSVYVQVCRGWEKGCKCEHDDLSKRVYKMESVNMQWMSQCLTSSTAGTYWYTPDFHKCFHSGTGSDHYRWSNHVLHKGAQGRHAGKRGGPGADSHWTNWWNVPFPSFLHQRVALRSPYLRARQCMHWREH